MHSRRFPLTAAIGLSLVSMGLFSMAANAAELSPDQLLKKPRPNNRPTSTLSGNWSISTQAPARHPG